ncbi:hypothetical protein OIU76_027677 [Salix suchowensis]|nr:hypothetical protein OIU76_027677 [Salix suchowensis]
MKVNEHPLETIKKVCSMIFSCFCFREVRLRCHFAREIQKLNDRIDDIMSEKKTFNFKISEGGPNLPEHRITASVIDATKIKGREKDRGTILKMLLSESSDQEPAPRTVSLVGMGGIGKTTLAQLVYNDHKVETNFGKRIWVCVSDPFDEIRIAKAILEALVGSAQDLIELQALLERIQESISGKRFLIVLDDVWNEDSTKWEQLENSLKRGCLPGSRFLVTTRKREVASIMGSSSTDILELGLLSPEIDGGPAKSKMESFSRDARHSMVVFGYDGIDPFSATILSFKKLRSLIVDDYPLPMNAALPDLLANLSCLRTLKLANCGIREVPSNIGKLIHLRLVDLSRNKIKELPKEMCELYNMQTLDVSSCSKLKKLPDNIGNLINLKHLSVGYGYDLSFVEMRGVEGLGCLRELDEFHVSGSGEGSNIGGLKNLNHLQGRLVIKWLGDVKDPNEVKKAELKSKENLTGLGLVFGSRTEGRIIRDDEILEALEPPPNIDLLSILDYQGIIQVLPSCCCKDRLEEI